MLLLKYLHWWVYNKYSVLRIIQSWFQCFRKLCLLYRKKKKKQEKKKKKKKRKNRNKNNTHKFKKIALLLMTSRVLYQTILETF